MSLEDFLKLLREYKDEIGVTLTFLSVFLAFLALVVSSLYTRRTLKIQREHNFKSVTPILQIIPRDHEEKLHLEIKNSGIGPLIITKSIVTKGNENKHSVMSFMPKHPDPKTIYWTTFQHGLDGICIPPGESVDALLLEGDWKEKDFVWFRNEVRRALSELTITVEYEDIYNRPMPTQTRNLKWFGRTYKPIAITVNKVPKPEF